MGENSVSMRREAPGQDRGQAALHLSVCWAFPGAPPAAVSGLDCVRRRYGRLGTRRSEPVGTNEAGLLLGRGINSIGKRRRHRGRISQLHRHEENDAQPSPAVAPAVLPCHFSQHKSSMSCTERGWDTQSVPGLSAESVHSLPQEPPAIPVLPPPASEQCQRPCPSKRRRDPPQPEPVTLPLPHFWGWRRGRGSLQKAHSPPRVGRQAHVSSG